MVPCSVQQEQGFWGGEGRLIFITRGKRAEKEHSSAFLLDTIQKSCLAFLAVTPLALARLTQRGAAELQVGRSDMPLPFRGFATGTIFVWLESVFQDTHQPAKLVRAAAFIVKVPPGPRTELHGSEENIRSSLRG